MLIRDATDADMPAVIAMAQAFCEAAGEPFDPKFAMANITAVRSGGFLLVADDEAGGVFGMLAAVRAPGLCSPGMCLHELCLWVDPDRRGGAALLRLVREFDRRAEASGARKAQLSALPSSPTGLANVYHRLGYQQADMSFHKTLGGH